MAAVLSYFSNNLLVGRFPVFPKGTLREATAPLDNWVGGSGTRQFIRSLDSALAAALRANWAYHSLGRRVPGRGREGYHKPWPPPGRRDILAR